MQSPQTSLDMILSIVESPNMTGAQQEFCSRKKDQEIMQAKLERS
jgi:hypothetical protein